MILINTVLLSLILNNIMSGSAEPVSNVLKEEDIYKTVEKLTKVVLDFETKFDRMAKIMLNMEKRNAHKENIFRKRIDSLEKQSQLLRNCCLRCASENLLEEYGSKTKRNTDCENINSKVQKNGRRSLKRRLLKNAAVDKMPRDQNVKDYRAKERNLEQTKRVQQENNDGNLMKKENLEAQMQSRSKLSGAGLWQRQANNEHRVAFYATITPHDLLHLGTNQPIVFDNVWTNIGGAYFNRSGVFIAPVNGIYMFSATLTGLRHYSSLSPDNYFYAHIDVNGRKVASFIHWPSYHKQSSQVIIVYLQEKDEVSVRNDLFEDAILGEEFSSFSGFLLYEDRGVLVNVIGK